VNDKTREIFDFFLRISDPSVLIGQEVAFEIPINGEPRVMYVQVTEGFMNLILQEREKQAKELGDRMIVDCRHFEEEFWK